MITAKKMLTSSLGGSKLPLFLLFLLSLCGVVIILYSTVWGAGLLDDAFIYLTSAKNLAVGNGLVWPWGGEEFRPLIYFPPMFPIALATFEFLGVDAVLAARLLNSIAFGVSLFFTGLLAHKVTRSWGFTLLTALIFLFSDVLIEVHAWAMSEPLYLLFALSSLYFLIVYTERRNWGWLIVSAVLAGLSFITRYIGMSILLAAITLLFFDSQIPWRRRLGNVLALGGIGSIPMVIWLVRNLIVINSVTDRNPGLYFITLQQFRKSINTMLVWFIPGRYVHTREFWWLAILLLMIIVIFLISKRFRIGQNTDSDNYSHHIARRLLALQVIYHVALVWISKSFFTPIIPLNNRIFSPILPSLIILIVALMADLWQSKRTVLRLAVLAASVIFLGFYLYRTITLVPGLHDVGLGLARKGWHRSQTIQAIRELPQVPIYSNSPAAIYMWTGRTSYPIDDQQQMRNSMITDGAVLVVFNSISLDLYRTSFDELTLGLVPVRSYRDGTIFQIQP
jgi:4-amino-4-deoxy-L-arabinose transferase-like glycosyltransferase